MLVHILIPSVLEMWEQLMKFRTSQTSHGKQLTFPYRDFSEYACGLADGTP